MVTITDQLVILVNRSSCRGAPSLYEGYISCSHLMQKCRRICPTVPLTSMPLTQCDIFQVLTTLDTILLATSPFMRYSCFLPPASLQSTVTLLTLLPFFPFQVNNKRKRNVTAICLLICHSSPRRFVGNSH